MTTPTDAPESARSRTGKTARARGRARELQVVAYYQAHGFYVARLARGVADVVALKAGCIPQLVQVKSTSRPYERFGPTDREALRHAAVAAGAEAVLVWWPKGKFLTLIPSEQWPS